MINSVTQNFNNLVNTTTLKYEKASDFAIEKYTQAKNSPYGQYAVAKYHEASEFVVKQYAQARNSTYGQRLALQYDEAIAFVNQQGTALGAKMAADPDIAAFTIALTAMTSFTVAHKVVNKMYNFVFGSYNGDGLNSSFTAKFSRTVILTSTVSFLTKSSLTRLSQFTGYVISPQVVLGMTVAAAAFEFFLQCKKIHSKEKQLVQTLDQVQGTLKTKETELEAAKFNVQGLRNTNSNLNRQVSELTTNTNKLSEKKKTLQALIEDKEKILIANDTIIKENTALQVQKETAFLIETNKLKTENARLLEEIETLKQNKQAFQEEVNTWKLIQENLLKQVEELKSKIGTLEPTKTEETV